MIAAFKKILPFLKNKFVLAILFFLMWVIFFDQNNLIDRVSALANFHQMQEDKIYFQEKIKTDSRKLEELRTDRENLEKFAREQYLMKKPDEDIFIVVGD